MPRLAAVPRGGRLAEPSTISAGPYRRASTSRPISATKKCWGGGPEPPPTLTITTARAGLLQVSGYDHFNDVATLLNVVLAFVPIEVIAVKHTTTISASITAYSTAVGPSSETKEILYSAD